MRVLARRFCFFCVLLLEELMERHAEKAAQTNLSPEVVIFDMVDTLVRVREVRDFILGYMKQV